MARQRGSTWQADVVLRNGKRLRPGGFTTQASAELWEAQTTSNDEQGLPPPPLPGKTAVITTGVTLAALRETVLATRAPEGWAGSKDLRNAEARSQMAVDFFGATKLASAIDSAEVQRYIRACEVAGNSTATVNRKVAALSKMLRYADNHRLIDRKPYMGKRGPEDKDAHMRWLTETEEASLLAMLELLGEHDVRQLVMFLLDTGARISEALGIRWGRFVQAESVTFPKTKAGSARTVPLTPRAQGVLKYFKDRADRLPDRGNEGPFMWEYWQVRFAFDKARKRLGKAFEDVTIHSLRHTCASRLVQRGVHLQIVKDFLGHSDFEMTLRYARLAPGGLAAAAQALAQPSNVVPLRREVA